jgi:hypothetical protein
MSVFLVTGDGQVGPGRDALAPEHEVIGWCFAIREARPLEPVSPCGGRLAKGSLDAVPSAVDFVCNFAVVKSNRWDVDIAGNAEAAGLLMAHCRTARSCTARRRASTKRPAAVRSSRRIRSATTTA